MAISHEKRIYSNPTAREWKLAAKIDTRIREFHKTLPAFSATPLISLDSVAKEVGVKHVFVKNESVRAGLPAFKILGASWAAYRAVAVATQNEIGIPLKHLSAAARKQNIKLFAATDGNHGRAIALMAKLMGIECDIFVPSYLDEPTRDRIATDRCNVITVDGDYDNSVQEALKKSKVPNGILIQDTAFEGYTEIPQWIVDGYSTMMVETEEQVQEQTGRSVDVVVVPVGVGSFAQSAVSYWKSRPYHCSTVTVEPNTAACLRASLFNGEITTVDTEDTVMSGMNCGTVSTIAWPVLKKGVDVSVAIKDSMADDAVQELESRRVNAGPCGAAPLAALKWAVKERRDAVDFLDSDATVVLFCTEGTRPYELSRVEHET